MPRIVAWSDAGAIGPRARERSMVSTRSWRSGSDVIQPIHKDLNVPWPQRTWFRLKILWERLQVSRRGEFSSGRLQLLHRYTVSASPWRVLLTLVLTPIPSLAFVLAIHCIPLRSPALGWQANHAYWIVLFATLLVVGQSFISQLKQVVPELPITGFQMLAVSLLASAFILVVAVFTTAVSVFPIPFGLVMFSPMFVFIVFVWIMLIVGEQVRARLPRLREKVRVYRHILAVEALLVIAYPAYNAIFVGLNGTQQALFVVMPSIMKFGVKNLLFKACEPLPLHDELPELMIFTADLFNTIYVTACMQTAGSGPLTTFVILMIGNLQLMMAVRTLLNRGKHLRRVLRQLRVEKRPSTSLVPFDFTKSGATIKSTDMEVLTAIGVRLCVRNNHRSSITRSALSGVEDINELFAQAGLARPTNGGGGRKIAVVLPGHIVGGPAQIVSTQAQERLVQHILKALFTCEYIILAEYVKCIIPIMSIIHTVVLFHLPVKIYFPYMDQFHNADEVNAATRQVLSFLIPQLVSVAFLWLLLRRQLRHSVLYHLAFVLEHNREMIQMRLLTWITFAFLLPIAHGGVDFTFQFNWIKHKKPPGI